MTSEIQTDVFLFIWGNMLCHSSRLSSRFIVQIHYEGSEFHYHPTIHPLVTPWGPRGPWRGLIQPWLATAGSLCNVWAEGHGDFLCPLRQAYIVKSVYVGACGIVCVCVLQRGLRVSPSGNRAKKQNPPAAGWDIISLDARKWNVKDAALSLKPR